LNDHGLARRGPVRQNAVDAHGAPCRGRELTVKQPQEIPVVEAMWQ
jgi:hypothetical protein